MSLKSDRWIRRMAIEHRMIEPFADRQVRDGVISYGVSSYGYDMRVAREFRIFTNVLNSVVDPKNFDPKSFVEFEGDVCIVPPNSFALARSVEYFRVPRNVLTVTVGKSTYARCGIITNVTPFEPEWEGFVTLEISNTTPLPARIYANEGIAQVLFFEGDEEPEISYRDKKGKYHHATARAHLRQRRHCSGALLRRRRGAGNLLPGQEREISGAAGRHTATALIAAFGWCATRGEPATWNPVGPIPPSAIPRARSRDSCARWCPG